MIAGKLAQIIPDETRTPVHRLYALRPIAGIDICYGRKSKNYEKDRTDSDFTSDVFARCGGAIEKGRF